MMSLRNVIALASLILVLIGTIASVVAMAVTMKENINTQNVQINNLTSSYIKTNDRLTECEKRNDVIDDKLTQIQTDILDIKLDMKKLLYK